MNPQEIFGENLAAFAGFTFICMGCASLYGVALARQWQPGRKVLPFGLALGLLVRLLSHTLFGGSLLSPTGFVIDTYFILMTGLLSYRYALARRLVRQYPWRYRQFLIFGWRRLSVD